MSDALTIGEVATRSGVATSALRFYDDQGLIHPERTDAGHRRYPRAVLLVVAFIVFAQKVGLSLDEIRVDSVATRNLVTCRQDSDLSEVERAMGERQVRRIPVLDGDDRLIGIVSMNDLSLRADGNGQRMREVAGTLANIGRHRQPVAT